MANFLVEKEKLKFNGVKKTTKKEKVREVKSTERKYTERGNTQTCRQKKKKVRRDGKQKLHNAPKF